MENSLKTVVMYHHPCHDGAVSAWIATRALADGVTDYKDKVDLIRARYNYDYSKDKDFLERIAGKRVFVLDFSIEPQTGLLAILTAASKVIIIDHHKTAFEKLMFISDMLNDRIEYKEFMERCYEIYGLSTAASDTLFKLANDKLSIELDNDRSGCGMTWDHFYPDVPVPSIVRHTQDRDLWKFKDANTRAFMANFMSFPMDIEVYEKIYLQLEEGDADTRSVNYNRFIEDGQCQLRLFNQYIDQICMATLKLVNIDGYNGVIVNSSAMFTSELGNRLAEKFDFALIWGFDNKNNDIVVGLRSRPGGGCDVSNIAKQHFNGGGHENASGGRVAFETLIKLIEGGENAKYQ